MRVLRRMQESAQEPGLESVLGLVRVLESVLGQEMVRVQEMVQGQEMVRVQEMVRESVPGQESVRVLVPPWQREDRVFRAVSHRRGNRSYRAI